MDENKFLDNNFGGVGLSLEELYRLSRLSPQERNGVNFERTFRQMEVISIQITAYLEEMGSSGEAEPMTEYLLREAASFVQKVKICIFNILAEADEFPTYLEMAEAEHKKRSSHLS